MDWVFLYHADLSGCGTGKGLYGENITRINLRFKVDNSLRLANDSTATTRGGDNNMMFELYTEKKSAAGGNGGDGSDDGGKGDGENPVVVAVVEKLRIRQHKLL